jgi:uncharacterized membrane protein
LAIPGALLVAIGATVADARFDAPALQWLGLGTQVPAVFDFQPFVLWFGVVLLGMAAASAAPDALWAWDRRALGAPAWLGRHSLLFYMGHVPVLMGIVEVARALTR